VRFIVQHAPYRLLFVAFSWLVPHLFVTYHYPEASWFLFSVFALGLGFINMIYPLVTRPLRRHLINAVDMAFGQTWFEEPEYEEAATQLAKAQLH
jgi:hypothetical protein